MTLAGKHGRDPRTPSAFDSGQDPRLVVDQYVMIRGISLGDIVEFMFLVDVNQDSGIEAVHQAGTPDLKRLKDYVAVTDNHRFAEASRIVDHSQRSGEQPVGEGIIG